MDLSSSTALVTGANRGLGREFARQLRDQGATVHAGARDPGAVDLEGVTPIAIDITDPASVVAAARHAADVDLLINNAGVATATNLVTGDLDQIRLEFDTHVFGTLAVVRAFAPVLAANGGGAILNVLSSLSWVSFDGSTAYSAAKAAEWSLTNGIRIELAGQGTAVSGLHLGAADTDMMASYDGPKLAPEEVVADALAGVAAGAMEILVGDSARQAKAAVGADPAEVYPEPTRAR